MGFVLEVVTKPGDIEFKNRPMMLRQRQPGCILEHLISQTTQKMRYDH